MLKDFSLWLGARDGRCPQRPLTERATTPQGKRSIRNVVYPAVWAVIALAALITLLPGCASKPAPAENSLLKPAPASSPGIDELNMLAVPMALDLDGAPGPDGFVITLYAGKRGLPKPVRIEKGTIEVFMFDGLINENKTPPAEPRKTWTLRASDLAAYRVETSIGSGYQITGLWGDAPPETGKISVMARYTAPNGGKIYSAPSVITVP